MSLLDIILNSDSFCNSDKYSFCFSLIQMPESQRELMIHQMNEQSSVSQEQLEQITKMTKSTLKKENISRQYIHDLYLLLQIMISPFLKKKTSSKAALNCGNITALKKQ